MPSASVPGGRHAPAELAEVGPPAPTRLALAARGHEREHDVVARPDALDPGARVDDHAGGLVAEDERERLREVAVDDVQVARADAARRDPDQRLAGVGRLELDVLDPDRLSRLPENGCLHPHDGERTALQP